MSETNYVFRIFAAKYTSFPTFSGLWALVRKNEGSIRFPPLWFAVIVYFHVLLWTRSSYKSFVCCSRLQWLVLLLINHHVLCTHWHAIGSNRNLFLIVRFEDSETCFCYCYTIELISDGLLYVDTRLKYMFKVDQGETVTSASREPAFSSVEQFHWSPFQMCTYISSGVWSWNNALDDVISVKTVIWPSWLSWCNLLDCAATNYIQMLIVSALDSLFICI